VVEPALELTGFDLEPLTSFGTTGKPALCYLRTGRLLIKWEVGHVKRGQRRLAVAPLRIKFTKKYEIPESYFDAVWAEARRRATSAAETSPAATRALTQVFERPLPTARMHERT
jgi:hypothetical protein